MLLGVDICLNTVYAWRIIGYILYIVRIVVPIVIIIMALKPFFNAVVKGTPEEITKSFKSLLTKIAAGLIIFLIPTAIDVVIKMLTEEDSTANFKICTTCMDAPSKGECENYVRAFDKLNEQGVDLSGDIVIDGKSGKIELIKEDGEVQVISEGNGENGGASNPEGQDQGEVPLPDGSGANGVISGDLEIHFINPSSRVDAIYIKVGDKAIFVDGGFKNDGKREMAYMDKLGVKSIDYYIGSHSHKNHVEAAPGIIQKYGIKNVLVGRETCNNSGSSYCSWYAISVFAKEQGVSLNGVNVKALKPDDTFTLNGLKITCLGPMSVNNSLNRGDTGQNYNSIILRLEYGNTSFMLTGDNSSSKNIKASYQKYGNLMKVDVLKNPHHNGNVGSSSYSIFGAKYVVYLTKDGYLPSGDGIRSTGASNYYIVTDSKSGNVVFSSDGNNINVKTNN